MRRPLTPLPQQPPPIQMRPMQPLQLILMPPLQAMRLLKGIPQQTPNPTTPSLPILLPSQ